MSSNVTTGTVERYYNFLITELADPRTQDWFLIHNPFPFAGIMMSYLYFTLYWGPRFMKNRKPFKLKEVLLVYNLFQVVFSIYLFVEGMVGAWLFHYSWKCEPIDFSTSPHAMRVARGVYMYFVAKLTELLDTVFFVLKKNDRQITFLHMYHHTAMAGISWGATKYLPGGHGIFIGIINSFIHIIMYTYYLLSALGPEVQKYLWWKKYITNLQMIQFCMIFIHSMQLLVYDCNYPKWTVILTLPNAVFFYYLFNDFYKAAYKKSAKKMEDNCRKTNNNNENNKPQSNGIARTKKRDDDSDKKDL